MADKLRSARMFERVFYCEDRTENKDGCGGRMLFNGEVMEISPPMFKHVCPNCRAVKFLKFRYPVMVSIAESEMIPKEWWPMIDVESLLPGEERDAIAKFQSGEHPTPSSDVSRKH